jgi:coproporphyrinogen III oxidase-like Fe-S oxidoreductase
VRERRIEFAMLALRTREGLSRAAFRRRFGLEVEAAFPELTPHLKAGALEERGDSLRLARASQLVADRILADLFP